MAYQMVPSPGGRSVLKKSIRTRAIEAARHVANAATGTGLVSGVAANYDITGTSALVSSTAYVIASSINSALDRLQGIAHKLDPTTQAIVDEILYTLDLLPDGILDHRFSPQVRSVAYRIRDLVKKVEKVIDEAINNNRFYLRSVTEELKQNIRDIAIQISLEVGHMNLLHNMST
jgi:hypothetical protein